MYYIIEDSKMTDKQPKVKLESKKEMQLLSTNKRLRRIL